MPVHHREAAGDVRVHRNVTGEVVAGREVVVARTVGEEAEVALYAARVPAVPRILVVASPVRAGIVAELERVPRRDAHVEGIEIGLVEPRVDTKLLPVTTATFLEVVLVRGEPAEVVVEGTVLHREHHDRVDRALRGRIGERAVGLQGEPRHVGGAWPARGRPAAAGKEPGAAEHGGAAHEPGGAQELASVHRAHPPGLYSTTSRRLSAGGRRGRRGGRGRRWP
jgi:hypothetical protein